MCSPFLETRLGVAEVSTGLDPLEIGLQQREDDEAGGVEAGVEVHGADDRLGAVGEDGVLVGAAGCGLAAPEPDSRTELDPTGGIGEGAGVDQRGPTLGEHAFGQRRVGVVEPLGDGELQHGIAEELETLVRRDAPVLAAPRSVAKGRVEQ